MPETEDGRELAKWIVPIGTILSWDALIRDPSGKPTGELRTLPEGWKVCNGTQGTPDLTDQFLYGASSLKLSGSTGGKNKIEESAPITPSGSVLLHNSHAHPDGWHKDNNNHLINSELRMNTIPGHTHNEGDNRPSYYSVIFIMRVF